MHVLFIGGTGLISTAIARQLMEVGHRVTCYNRGKSQSRLPDGKYEVILGDRKDTAAFEAAFSDKTYDVVVDMVAFHPDDTASAIRAFSGRCGQFIHCSTVCVYSGPPLTIPVPETEPYHSPGGYGKNKAECEKLLLQAFANAKFPATIMRPSHSYGEGGTLIRPFGPGDTHIARLRAGLPVIVPGDGTNLWAACHVDDVARGFIAAMGEAKTHGEAYNITGDEYMTWNTYGEIIAAAAGGTYNPVFLPTDILVQVAPQYSGGTKDIFAWPSIFDNRKIKAHTSYTGQRIPLSEGASRTIAWGDENGKNAPVKDDEYEEKLIAAWRSSVVASLPRQE